MRELSQSLAGHKQANKPTNQSISPIYLASHYFSFSFLPFSQSIHIIFVFIYLFHIWIFLSPSVSVFATFPLPCFCLLNLNLVQLLSRCWVFDMLPSADVLFMKGKRITCCRFSHFHTHPACFGAVMCCNLSSVWLSVLSHSIFQFHHLCY